MLHRIFLDGNKCFYVAILKNTYNSELLIEKWIKKNCFHNTFKILENFLTQNQIPQKLMIVRGIFDIKALLVVVWTTFGNSQCVSSFHFWETLAQHVKLSVWFCATKASKNAHNKMISFERCEKFFLKFCCESFFKSFVVALSWESNNSKKFFAYVVTLNFPEKFLSIMLDWL